MPNDLKALIAAEQPRIFDLLGNASEQEKRRFIALALMEISRPDYAKYTEQSKLKCVIEAASCQLELGTAAGEAYLIPYGNELTFQPSYRGKIKNSIRAGVATHFYAELVYERDRFQVRSGSVRAIEHTWVPGSDRGALIGSYAVAYLANGIQDFEVFEKRDIDAVKAAALRNAQRRDKSAGLSPAWRFFEGEMIKKSNLRRLEKRLVASRSGAKDMAAFDAYLRMVEIENRDFEFEAEATALTDQARMLEAALSNPPLQTPVPAKFANPAPKAAAAPQPAKPRQVTPSSVTSGTARQLKDAKAAQPQPEAAAPAPALAASEPAPEPDGPPSREEINRLFDLASEKKVGLMDIARLCQEIGGAEDPSDLDRAQFDAVLASVQQA
jgi:recombination protein RecT